MRSALAIATVLFAALSGLLLLEVRDAWNTAISASVDQSDSSIRSSAKLRGMLVAGEIDAAISELDKIETANTFLLSEIASEIRSPSWRWGDQAANLQKAEQHLDAN